MKNLHRYLLIGTSVLSSVITYTTQAAEYTRPEISEIKPLTSDSLLAGNGEFIVAITKRNALVHEGLVYRRDSNHTFSERANIQLFDDDGFLTLATVARLLQEYVVQQKILTNPENKEEFLADFLEKPIFRQDILRPLLRISVNRLLEKFVDYPRKNASNFSDLMRLDEILQSNSGETLTYNLFFNSFGKWVRKNQGCFGGFASDRADRAYRVEVVGIGYNSFKWDDYKFHCSALTCNFANVMQNLEMSLRQLPATSLLTNSEINEVLSQPQHLLSLSCLTNKLLGTGNIHENQLLSGLDIWNLLTIISNLPEGDPLRSNLTENGLDASLSYYKALKKIASASGIIDFFHAALLPTGYAQSPLPKAINKDELWFDLGKPTDVVATKINTTVMEKTHGLINDFVTPGDLENIDFAIFATTYLKTLWENKFNREENNLFTNSLNEPQNVTFLKGTMRAGYQTTDDALILDIPLKGKAHYMVWMPKTNTSAPQFFDTNWLTNLTYGDVQLSYPKLDIETNADLLSMCQSIGMNSLSGKFWNGLILSKFFQKARLKTTLEGVEAAAATGMFFKASCIQAPPPRIDINSSHSISIVLEVNPGIYLPAFTGWIASVK